MARAADDVISRSNKMTPRQRHVFKAELYRDSKLFDKMYDEMRSVADTDVELTETERALFIQASRKEFRALLRAWKALCEAEAKEHEQRAAIAKDCRLEAQGNLTTFVKAMNGTLLHHLITTTKSPEDKVLYQKMVADNMRCLAEVVLAYEDEEGSANLKTFYILGSKFSYLTASNLAGGCLCPLDPLRLNVALAYASLARELLHRPGKARGIAKAAVREADRAKALDHEVDDQRLANESERVLTKLRDFAGPLSSTDDDGANDSDEEVADVEENLKSDADTFLQLLGYDSPSEGEDSKED